MERPGSPDVASFNSREQDGRRLVVFGCCLSRETPASERYHKELSAPRGTPSAETRSAPHIMKLDREDMATPREPDESGEPVDRE